MRSSLLFALLLPLAASGELLLEQGFEGDSLPGWRESGQGKLQITEYAGNRSLRLSRKKAATLGLSTAGFTNVSVRMQLAAADLEKFDRCHAEFSLDGGETWLSLITLGDGQDDGVTLHSGRAAPAALSNNPAVQLRFRADAKDERDWCWGDNVRLSGDRIVATTMTGKQALTAEFLFGSNPLASAVPMSAFAAPGGARAPADRRTGRLLLHGGPAAGFKVIEDRFNYQRDVGDVLQTFPNATFDWVEGDGNVVPLREDVQRGMHPAWEIAFQPGRVWYPDDNDALRRYAVPFALLERNANCTHNGVLTWLIDTAGKASRVAFEIASETCAYLKFDMWGTLDADFSSRPAANEALGAYQRSASARLPTKSFDALSELRPKIDAERFGSAGYGDPADTTVYGFVVDGQHYRSACPTRFGPYPFCAEILLPSFSTAKSLFGGIGLMRLEALYPGAAKTRVASLLPECERAGWDNVTIEDALGLATGRYNDTGLEVDESAAEHVEFLYAASHREKIEFACSFFPRKSAPGTLFAYHTSDTYVAGTAMRAYLQEQIGSAVDLYATLLLPIWESLDLSAAIRSTRTTYDETAQPLVGWGLSFQPDDIARIAAWLGDGAPLPAALAFDRPMFAAAMQRDSDDRGLRAGAANARYNNGFWGLDIAEFVDCKKPVWVPFMSGHGGISVVMFPNGTVYYHFSDGYVYRWREAAIESNKIRNMCT